MEGKNIQGDLETGRLSSLHDNDVLTLDLVSAFAGDRPLTEFEATLLADLEKSLDGEFFPGLLYAITHECFPPVIAEGLWNEIIRHEFTKRSGKNRMMVAGSPPCAMPTREERNWKH